MHETYIGKMYDATITQVHAVENLADASAPKPERVEIAGSRLGGMINLTHYMPGKLDCSERDASSGARRGHELGATRALLRYWSAIQPGSAARPVGAGWPLSVAARVRASS
jgi:hypothetical protein